MLEEEDGIVVADRRLDAAPWRRDAVAGWTIFNPGVWAKYASGFCEWNGPPCTPPPDGPRTTSGTPTPVR